MLSKDTLSDHKHRIVTIFTTLALAMSGLVISPANATLPEGGNATVNCSVDGTFTITNYVVTLESSCEGEAVIPEGVTGIDDNFRFANQITLMIIPATVTIIGEFGTNTRVARKFPILNRPDIN